MAGTETTQTQPETATDTTSVPPTFTDGSQVATNVNETPNTTANKPKTTGAPSRVLVEQLQQLEEQYTTASQQPIGEQPVEQMLADYQSLAAEANLPPASKQVAEFRIQSLMIRKDALDSYRAQQVAIEDAAAKQRDLQAEQVELEQRVAQTQITTYTALGRLSISSLQAGSETLYRLVDPANSRLVIYIRTNDPTIIANVDQFVGITGDVVNDPTLKLTYIRPTEIKIVDPNTVNYRAFAQYTPPSLLTTQVAGDGGLEQ
ncbi:MAG TPA: hypothetical protein PK402_04900 [Tepidisphaeraceae bacterium]|nr:hypothetical protein [Tepidisphaeraceae bacterium]